MTKEMPKISVLVITYNQENVIDRTIKSLLTQRDYIYEICVSDDCSKDRTWDILQNYFEEYPGLFVLNRNEPNVGIFENIEKTWTMPSGNIIYQISGDDECGVGWFKKVIDFITSQKIDYKNEYFCIYGDYMEIYPNGATITHCQDLVKKNPDRLLDMSIKGLISNRSTCFGKLVLERFKRVSQKRSYKVESAQTRQLQMFTKKNYYMPFVGNIYYAGIGVSAHLNSDIISEQKEEWDYLKTIISSESIILEKSTLSFIEYKNHYLRGEKIKAFVFFLKSIKISEIGCLIRLYLMRIIKRTPLFTRRNYRI